MANLPEVTLEKFNSSFEAIQASTKRIIKNPKWERRFTCDYAGNDEKLRDIFREVSDLEREYFDKINHLLGQTIG